MSTQEVTRIPLRWYRYTSAIQPGVQVGRKLPSSLANSMDKPVFDWMGACTLYAIANIEPVFGFTDVALRAQESIQRFHKIVKLDAEQGDS